MLALVLALLVAVFLVWLGVPPVVLAVALVPLGVAAVIFVGVPLWLLTLVWWKRRQQ